MPPTPLYRLPAPQARATVGWKMAGLLALALANGGWLSTSYIAWRVHYAPSLGRPWIARPAYPDRAFLAGFLILVAATTAVLLFDGCRRSAALLAPTAVPVLLAALGPLYSPLQAVLWLHRYGEAAQLKAIVAKGEALGLAGVAGTMAAAIGYAVASFARLRRVGDLHGSSHWATPAEIAQAGLQEGEVSGIVVGSLGRRFLTDPRDRHALVFAPSGAGKSSSLVVPTLLVWRDSALVLDIKAELWQLTAGYRLAEGQVCIRFDPTLVSGSASYNPLLSIPRTEEDVAYAQDVADILMNPEGREAVGGDRFFNDMAKALLTGVILHALYTETLPNLGMCLHLLSSPKPTETWEAIRTAVHDLDGERGWKDPATGDPTATHPAVATALGRLLGMDFRTASGVQATAIAALALFADPVVTRNTTESDFRAEDLIAGKKPVSVYLTVAPSNLDRLRPLLRILVQQMTRHLTREIRRDRRPVLYMLDEFTALGKLDHLERALAFLRGYSVRVFLSIQSIEQLSQTYGPHQSISANCVQIAFGANDFATAKLLSELTGKRTVEYRRESRHASVFGGRRTENEAEVGRPLLSPDEVRRLPAGSALIYVGGCAPILGGRRPYWQDPILAQRAAAQPPLVKDRVTRKP